MDKERVLLLCDVVDSTALTERLGNAAAGKLWCAHDVMARTLLTRWRGREVDKTDGLFALFDTVRDALDFATAYHHALNLMSPPLQGRVAIHCATVLLRETSAAEVARGAKPLDVDGIAKPLTARMGALALRGQTLLSEAAAFAMGEGPMLSAVGHWRFKGVTEPMALFEPSAHSLGPPSDVEKAWRVTHDGQRWLPTREVQHSLPADRDGFVGRRPALTELADAFAGGARLVTVLGLGGTGKTRLAQRHGWDALGGHGGGVWFCDLSQAVSLDGIVHGVAQGLQLPLGASDPVQQIGNAIAGRGEALVILDNFEQVARHAEASLGCWLARASAATFLVTSREVLGITGEHTMALSPLPDEEGAELFIRRASAAVGSFSPDAADLPVIEELVRLLDGLPLSIELAAARVCVMTPRTMLSRMGERFKLLATLSGRRDRQATLRATLDWSWDLLSETERVALAQLSVFEGGFSLPAAEAVLELKAVAGAAWPVDVVQALVQKSLLRTGAAQRLEMLRSVQEYAAERLAANVDAVQSTQARHGVYFSALPETAMRSGEHDADVDNLVAATRRALDVNNAELAIRALIGAWEVLSRTGPFAIASNLAEAALARAAPSSETAALAWWVAGCAEISLGKSTHALVHLHSGLAHAKAGSTLALRLQCALAEAQSGLGHMTEAGEHLDQALANARVQTDDRLLCRALNQRGAWLMRQSRLQESQSIYEEALQVALRAQDERWQGGILGNLGVIAQMLGDVGTARQHYEAALIHATAKRDRRWEGNTRCNLGLLHQDAGQALDAELQFSSALSTARHLGHRRLECTVLCNLGLLRNSQSQFDEAVNQFQAAVQVAKQIDDPRSQGQILGYQGLALAHLGRIAEAETAFKTGGELLSQLQDPLSLGLLHCAQAQACLLSGLAERSRVLVELAQSELIKSGAGSASELGHAIDSLRGQLVG